VGPCVVIVDVTSLRRVEAIARSRCGVFTYEEAIAAGFTDRMIRRRLADGRFLRLHPGVYALAGATLTWRSQLWAACAWSREGVVSHRCAAALHRLKGFEEVGRPEITVTSCHLPPRSGIIVHVTDRLPREQRRRASGFPITSIERTLLDLGAVCNERKVAIALDDALLREVVTVDSLDECLRLTARRGRRGCGVLRRLLKRRMGLSVPPNSPAETVLFDLLCRSTLPRPELQYRIDFPDGSRAFADFAWPDRRFAVEMDGYQHHWGRHAFERDRDRLNKLTLTDWKVMFATWREATQNPDGLVLRIERGYEAAGRAVLSERGPLKRGSDV